jgi:hypothetical protein
MKIANRNNLENESDFTFKLSRYYICIDLIMEDIFLGNLKGPISINNEKLDVNTNKSFPKDILLLNPINISLLMCIKKKKPDYRHKQLKKKIDFAINILLKNVNPPSKNLLIRSQIVLKHYFSIAGISVEHYQGLLDTWNDYVNYNKFNVNNFKINHSNYKLYLL